VQLLCRRAAGEILFGHRLQDVATVRLEQYAEPIPKALVILWQALIHKGQGIASEGIFRVTGSKDEIAASKKFISSGAWDKKVLGGALNGVFDKEWWQGQEHPKDAFCAGNLIKVLLSSLTERAARCQSMIPPLYSISTDMVPRPAAEAAGCC